MPVDPGFGPAVPRVLRLGRDGLFGMHELRRDSVADHVRHQVANAGVGIFVVSDQVVAAARSLARARQLSASASVCGRFQLRVRRDGVRSVELAQQGEARARGHAPRCGARRERRDCPVQDAAEIHSGQSLSKTATELPRV
jgi:sRNA-binding protein